MHFYRNIFQDVHLLARRRRRLLAEARLSITTQKNVDTVDAFVERRQK